MEGKARTRHDILKVVLGPYVQYCLGTDRNGLLAAGPDLAGPDLTGYQFTIRLAGFCRTKTGVWRVKYKAAGTCRKI